MIFSKIIFVDFFFNIELVKNYNYNKAKSYGESVVVFLTLSSAKEAQAPFRQRMLYGKSHFVVSLKVSLCPLPFRVACVGFGGPVCR